MYAQVQNIRETFSRVNNKNIIAKSAGVAKYTDWISEEG